MPEAVARLFWDVDPTAVDLHAHADYVIERVMSRGGWDAMRWLREVYSIDQLRDFVIKKGGRLPARELAYWALVTGAEVEIPSGGGRPVWAGK